MKSIRIRKIFIIAVALSGAIINASYGAGLFKAFLDPFYSSVVREFLISAIILEFGWTALLVWMVFRPFERRHILLFTVIPILLGNILHSFNQSNGAHGSMGAIASNLTVGLIFSGLYVAAFLAGKPADLQKKESC